MRIGRLKLMEKRIIDNDPEMGPLVIRWVIIRHPKLFGVFLHKLCRSDHDRALHDHPWGFLSFVLRGYREWRHVRDIYIGPAGFIEEQEELVHHFGSILRRPALWRHRVIIDDKPAWTLVFMGPHARKWGFWPNGEWCDWTHYDTHKGICEEDAIYDGDGD